MCSELSSPTLENRPRRQSTCTSRHRSRRCALAVVFAGADPDHQVVLRVDRHAANRVRPWELSKIGFHVVPELVVFHTPPDAATMYQVLRLTGSTAMSLTRPDMNAGPI